MFVEQISVFMENKPGRVVAVTETLCGAGVNIRAMAIADTSNFGVIRMIVDDPERGFDALKRAHMTICMNDVLAVRIEDSPGGLNSVLRVLAQNNINLEYAYAYISRVPDTAVVVLRVEEENGMAALAAKALEEAGFVMLDRKVAYG